MVMKLWKLTNGQIVYFGLFQYNIVLLLTAVITAATRATGVYCEVSNHASYAHLWVR
jgi:hypothetical protein